MDTLNFRCPVAIQKGTLGFESLESGERAGLEIPIWEGGVGIWVVSEATTLDEITKGLNLDREGGQELSLVVPKTWSQKVRKEPAEEIKKEQPVVKMSPPLDLLAKWRSLVALKIAVYVE